MSKVLVATSPAHDDVTEYVDIWLEKTLAKFEGNPDLEIIRLKANDAERAALEQAIATHAPKLVLFNGHGNSAAMGGFQNGVLIRCDDNESVLAGRITHMLACETAAALGPRVIEAGGLAYIGYRLPFELRFDGGATSREARSRDPFAALTLDPAFAAVEALISGDTVEIAFRESQLAHGRTLQGLMATGSNEAQRLGMHVWHNMRCQAMLGDGNATF